MREVGYYWVVFNRSVMREDGKLPWEVAYWNQEYWEATRDGFIAFDEGIHTIGRLDRLPSPTLDAVSEPTHGDNPSSGPESV